MDAKAIRKAFARAREIPPPYTPAQLAQKLGGKYLGRDKLGDCRWRCGRGHRFAEPFERIYSGSTWCRKCDEITEADGSTFARAVWSICPSAVRLQVGGATTIIRAQTCGDVGDVGCDHELCTGFGCHSAVVSLAELRLYTILGYNCMFCAWSNVKELRKVMAGVLMTHIGVGGVSAIVAEYMSCRDLVPYSLTDESSEYEIDSVLEIFGSPESMLVAIGQIPAPRQPKYTDEDRTLMSERYSMFFEDTEVDDRFCEGEDDEALGGAHNAQHALLPHVWWRPAETVPYLPDLAGGRSTLTQYLTFRTITGLCRYRFFGRIAYRYDRPDTTIFDTVVDGHLPSPDWRGTDPEDSEEFDVAMNKLTLRDLMTKYPHLNLREALLEIRVAEDSANTGRAWGMITDDGRSRMTDIYRAWCQKHGLKRK